MASPIYARVGRTVGITVRVSALIAVGATGDHTPVKGHSPLALQCNTGGSSWKGHLTFHTGRPGPAAPPPSAHTAVESTRCASPHTGTERQTRAPETSAHSGSSGRGIPGTAAEGSQGGSHQCLRVATANCSTESHDQSRQSAAEARHSRHTGTHTHATVSVAHQPQVVVASASPPSPPPSPRSHLSLYPGSPPQNRNPSEHGPAPSPSTHRTAHRQKTARHHHHRHHTRIIVAVATSETLSTAMGDLK